MFSRRFTRTAFTIMTLTVVALLTARECGARWRQHHPGILNADGCWLCNDHEFGWEDSRLDV